MTTQDAKTAGNSNLDNSKESKQNNQLGCERLLATQSATHKALAQCGSQKEQNQSHPHPDREAGNILAFRFLGFRFGQWCLTAPTNLFILWIPFATVRTIHRYSLLGGFDSKYGSIDEIRKQQKDDGMTG